MMKNRVYLNGRLVGEHKYPDIFINRLRRLRRCGKLPYDVSITYIKENHEVQVYTDRGRVLRPLIVVDEGAPRLNQSHIEKLKSGDLTWERLICMDVVEYLDAEEEESAYVALTEDQLTSEHTHLEISPSLILGVAAGYVPYPEHNSSPRVTMAAAMAKQCLGVYASNYLARFDSRGNVLHYTQKPIVKTDETEVLDLEKRPSGQNFIVAVMSYKGYNMEDAIILNKSSVDRGLGRSTFYRTYELEERVYPGGQRDIFNKPEGSLEGQRMDSMYCKIDDDGVVLPETYVESDDIIIGRTSPPKFLEEIGIYGVVKEKRRDTSASVRHLEDGIVDAVVLTESVEKNKMIKVRIRTPRVPEIGDKFASRHGQKGVVGMLVPHEDMPFTKDGVVPDLIINPHAIPSRMTIGHVLDMIGGKGGSLTGKYIDGTAFKNDNEEYLRKMLEENGFKSTGKECMYDGDTGESFKVEIFIGCIFYQKLHHMVSNKMHARSRGPVQILTKQPTEGRAREGGLRFGEMERDCLISHGTSMLIKDRLLDESDRIVVPVCSKCGLVAMKDFERRRVVCPICGDVPCYDIEMSYAFKLLLDELKGMCVMPKLIMKDKI